jgi:hypothetical protein
MKPKRKSARTKAEEEQVRKQKKKSDENIRLFEMVSVVLVDIECKH